jgi:hypothetical protein
MEEAIKAYENLKKNYDIKSKRVRRLIENSEIIEKDYNDMENENNQLRDFIHKKGLSLE